MDESAQQIDFRTLLEHRAFVRSVVRRLLRDENLVDDVVQETWLAALRRPPR
ncbi:MAG: sigma factor, partial [Planctomycetota bacterium]